MVSTARQVRHFAAMCMLVSPMLGYAAEAEAVPQAKPGVLRLGIPYPLSGPPEIQAADRATRRYRVIAAHAVPPVSDALAKLIADAVSLGEYGSVEYVRRPGIESFERRSRDGSGHPKRSVHMVLAGDDLIRGHSTSHPDARSELRLRVAEPLALMPFALLCTSRSCAGRIDAVGAMSAARLREGVRSIGSAGERSTGYRAARMLRAALRTDALLVTYSAGAAALSAVIAAEIDAAFVPLPLALGYIPQSKLRALGLTSEHRFESLRSVPTLAELGLTDLVIESWFALFATEHLPTEYATEMARRVRAYRLEPASRMELLARGLTPAELTAEEFAVRLAVERDRWRAERNSKR